VAEEIDRYLASGERSGLRAWVDARTAFDDLEPSRRHDAVALLTFHAAKGREWSAVVVTGVEDGLVPHSSATTAAQVDEEARLLYVALTRAAEHLTITHSAERRGVPTAPSPWLDGIARATAPEPVSGPPPGWTHAPADPLGPLRQWRSGIARVAGVPDAAVCTDAVLRSLATDPPADMGELARRLGISPAAAARLRPLPATG
jgi:DNA helicase-2/ATP-dependent DNA helicase PcrA